MCDIVMCQLGQQTQEIQSRDRQLSQSAHQMASLRAKLGETTEQVSQLQSSLDASNQNYNVSTQRCVGLESETTRLREQLCTSQHQVVVTDYPLLLLLLLLLGLARVVIQLV